MTWYDGEECAAIVAASVAKDLVRLEALRKTHRDAAHLGLDGGDECAPCGFMDAAIYRAKTGRSLVHDFINAEPITGPAEPQP
jgi:hypothetical protein